MAACEGDHWDQRRKALFTRKLAGNIRQPRVREGNLEYNVVIRRIRVTAGAKNCVGIKRCKDSQCSCLTRCAHHPSYHIMNLCSFEGEYSIEIYVVSHWGFSYVHWMGSCLTGLQLINYYVNNKYTLRYTGGMVPDVNQVLVFSNLPINCLSWIRFWKAGISLHPEGKSMYQLGHAKLRSPHYFVQGRQC